MSLEKSAGAVIFRKEKGRKFYLVLHYPRKSSVSEAKRQEETKSLRPRGSRTPDKDYWGFAKGHIEKKEKPEEAARREIFEETGIKDIELIKGFKEWIKYFFKQNEKNIFKIVTFFLAETKTKEVKISWEHIGYKWLPYEQALERLTFKNAKEILKKASQHLARPKNV